MADIILFVNHLEENCGVYQHFKRLILPILSKLPYEAHYIETNQEWEFDHWVNVLNPTIIVYNFYFSGVTMPWLTNDKIQQNKHRLQFSIHHEGSITEKGFDGILHQDPLNTDTSYYNLARPIPVYDKTTFIRTSTDNPIIGTFGFGLGGKGFDRLVHTVISEYDRAHIRMNIPFAHFGDSNGDGARWWASHCQSIVSAANKPDIQLTVTHTLLPEYALLDFLAENDLNAFLYDSNGGRGISGTVDYALAVDKPIAITKSDQFKHIWQIDDSFCIENTSLRTIMSRGINHLTKFKQMWNNDQLVADFIKAFNTVRNK